MGMKEYAKELFTPERKCAAAVFCAILADWALGGRGMLALGVAGTTLGYLGLKSVIDEMNTPALRAYRPRTTAKTNIHPEP